jgi:hypothetical protein
LEFNNQIDAASFSKELIKIEPAVENLNIYPSGNHVYIQGYKKGRTTYKITVDGTVKDVFGQSLNTPATATIKVGAAETSLYAQGGTMVVLDPNSKPAFSIYSTINLLSKFGFTRSSRLIGNNFRNIFGA